MLNKHVNTDIYKYVTTIVQFELSPCDSLNIFMALIDSRSGLFSAMCLCRSSHQEVLSIFLFLEINLPNDSFWPI